MIDTLTQWMPNMIQNLIPMLIFGALVKLWSIIHSPIQKAIGAAMPAMRALLPMLFSLLRHLFVLGFLSWQLSEQLTKSGPATRGETLLISFWSFWLLLYVVREFIDKKPAPKPLNS